MPIELVIGVALFGFLLTALILFMVRKGSMSVRYSVVWLLSSLVILAVLIPNFMVRIANFLGIQVLSNMIFGILIGILMLITMSLTIIASNQKERISLLIQEVSILKSEKKNEKRK